MGKGFFAGGGEGVSDFPFFCVLADAMFVHFVFDGGFLLGPSYEAFEVYFVAAGDDDVGDFAIFDGPADGLGIYAKKSGCFGD